METIQSPKEISLLMENLWLRHIAGMKQHPNNVYMVELPPPTEKEVADTRHKAKENSQFDYESEELYGVWI